jgi:hypothetical protein
MTGRQTGIIEHPAESVAPAFGAPVRYTLATLVTDHVQYNQMLQSFRSGGFDNEDCEYLFIDNSRQNKACAYRGLNLMLNAARGAFVILCHQDVRLLSDDRATLDARLTDLDTTDPTWALAGNAGGTAPGTLAIRITDPHGADQRTATLPARAMSLDENFIVVRREARFGFSRDLTGFHLYGADICLNAAMAGYSAFVIDFHLAHLSGGTLNQSFTDAAEAFRAKWSRALAPRWMQTTCTLLHLSGSHLGQLAGGLAEKPYAALQRQLAKLGER